MGLYRTIHTRIFSDEKFRNLSGPQPCGQYLWIYLLIGPHTSIIPGLYRASAAGIAAELGWKIDKFMQSFKELENFEMAKADWGAHLIWIPKAIKYNEPRSPNVVKGWANRWGDLPECDLKAEAFCVFKDFLNGFSEPFRKEFEKLSKEISNPSGKIVDSFRNQEQDQEQDQEQNQKQEKTTVPTSKLAEDSCSIVQKVWDHYRGYHPGTAKQLKSTRKEYRLIKQRLEDFDAETLKRAIDGYHKSDWHQGKNERGKKYLSLELMMRDISHVQSGLEHTDNQTIRNSRYNSLPDLTDYDPLAKYKDIEDGNAN